MILGTGVDMGITLRMPRKGELDPNEPTKAWNCEWCGRMEDAGTQRCPECETKGRKTKRQRCSRYEWFLADALEEVLSAQDRDYSILEQWEMPDHRGFTWYFDLCVWVRGKSSYGGHSLLIEVNGASHDVADGHYDRDMDKDWEFHSRGLHRKGYSIQFVTNDECRQRVVKDTARRLATEIIQRADTW